MLQINKRRIKIAVSVLFLLIITLFSALYAHIDRFGQISDSGQADVIIVLGAAVWPNGPSPALQARVWHARQLYHAGRAPYMIVAGGMGLYPPTEAEAMSALAVAWDVPQSQILLEDKSTNTRENLTFAADIMRQKGWQTALLVTDGYHMRRASALAQDLGIKVLRAPVAAESSYYGKFLQLKYTLRECLAFLHYLVAKKIEAVFSLQLLVDV
ncbi:MAG: YdcF family protein [Firmicutes bacterium]|nr:YdcF family protein [Bacillota bacterium]